jgi:hypothetical protein
MTLDDMFPEMRLEKVFRDGGDNKQTDSRRQQQGDSHPAPGMGAELTG